MRRQWYKYWVERATEFDLGNGFRIVKQTIDNEVLFCIHNKQGYTLQKDGKWDQEIQIYDRLPGPSTVKLTRFSKLHEAFDFFVRYIEEEASK